MHENITRVAERGERLDALQDKTGECGPVARLEGVTRCAARECHAEGSGYRLGAVNQRAGVGGEQCPTRSPE